MFKKILVKRCLSFFGGILFLLSLGCGTFKVNMTESPESLSKYALDRNESIAVREAAIAKLHDRDFLYQVAEKTVDPVVAEIAVSKINDPHLLAKLAYKANFSEVRIASINRVTDAFLLEQIAQHSKDDKTALIALSRISDPEAFLRLSISAENPYIQLGALYEVQDPQILRSIALERDNLDAVDRIDDPQILLEIAIAKTNNSVGEKAKNKLSLEQLEDLSKNSPEKFRDLANKFYHERLVTKFFEVDDNEFKTLFHNLRGTKDGLLIASGITKGINKILSDYSDKSKEYNSIFDWINGLKAIKRLEKLNTRVIDLFGENDVAAANSYYIRSRIWMQEWLIHSEIQKESSGRLFLSSQGGSMLDPLETNSNPISMRAAFDNALRDLAKACELAPDNATYKEQYKSLHSIYKKFYLLE